MSSPDVEEDGGRFAESFRAPYRGRCQNCPDPVEKGESIVLDHHGTSRGQGWVHDECA